MSEVPSSISGAALDRRARGLLRVDPIFFENSYLSRRIHVFIWCAADDYAAFVYLKTEDARRTEF